MFIVVVTVAVAVVVAAVVSAAPQLAILVVAVVVAAAAFAYLSFSSLFPSSLILFLSLFSAGKYLHSPLSVLAFSFNFFVVVPASVVGP